MVIVLGMVTIIFMMTNDDSRDGVHDWGCLKFFAHFGDDHLPREGDNFKNGDHHRGGDHPRGNGCLRDFYRPKGWLLNFGSVDCNKLNKFKQR